MGDTEQQQLLWKSEQEPESIVSVTLARAMSVLLSTRPKKLQDAISRLSPSSQAARPSSGSLEDSLWFLHKYVKDAAEKKETLDQILVPMIENSLRCKQLKHGGQAMVLINWLFQDELLFEAMAKYLADVIMRKDDRYLSLGWCILVRRLVEYESYTDQFTFDGLKDRYEDLLRILCACFPHLASIVCKGSTLQDGFEFPSRLSVSAADCFLALTEALSKKAKVQGNRSKSNLKTPNQSITLAPGAIVDKKVTPVSNSSEISHFERDYYLWQHLEELICLAEKLLAWSRKSRFLHAKGLEQVFKWLQEIKEHYGHAQQADSKIVKTGMLLLSSCWKHYSTLLHLEDQKFSQRYKELLDHYLSGIQYFADNQAGGHTDNKDGGVETRKFFVNCLCLLLGRLELKKFESTVSEYGMQISQILLPQLHCDDEDLIVGVVSIIKTIILNPSCSAGSRLTDTARVDVVLPFLLHLLDERDGTARAVVLLIAEYCSMRKDEQCLKEVFMRLSSGNVIQRRNAIDVISELIHISSDSAKVSPHLTWQDIANHLLKCLEDEEVVIQEQASNLLSLIDPSLVLPGLVGLIYSSDESLQSSAADALIRVLKYHSLKVEVIWMLLDNLSNVSHCLDHQETTRDEGGSGLDSDRVLRLIPEWSKSVHNWNCFIGPLIDKMFAEPSNAIIVRFLSYISEHLANAADIVLHHVLFNVKQQKECENRTKTNNDAAEMQQSLFEHLCPLLIIKMLPLQVFNDLNLSTMYGHLSQDIMLGCGDTGNGDECIAALLLNRTFCKFEFEDVRKLSAELCGRIHPQVLLPIVCSELEHATVSQDILTLKACLLSVCTSLVVRGKESFSHPAMLEIRKMIETVLLWPSLEGDPVSKAQHGCIDSLALMICAELQAGSFKDSTSEKISIVGKKAGTGYAASGISILTYIIEQFIHDKNDIVSKSKSDNGSSAAPVPLSFRICLANVLISACQKVSDSCKKPFARKALPYLNQYVEVTMNLEIRVACIQVLFSAVYHLRSAVLPYASDLLKISVKALRKDSEKERMAGAKLMASLMASEDAILESISGELLEARSVLSTISLVDPSFELRKMCKKLLLCITST